MLRKKCLVEKLSGEVDVVEGSGDGMSRLRVGVGFHALHAIVGHFLGEVLRGEKELIRG